MKVIIESGSANESGHPDIRGLQVVYGGKRSCNVIGKEVRINMLYKDGPKLIEVDGGILLTKDNACLLMAALEVFIKNQKSI